jgi:1-acyl-sn-glycerol-3-phosphate acyltransferase
MRKRGISDRLARGLARLLIGVFYRRVEVEGSERVPEQGAVLFVANHGNALVDPMLLVGLLPRLPRFLAKHTLWKNPLVRPLLALAGSIPVYRAQDGGTARNDEAFARCFEVLAAGGAVGLFPEGTSHDEPSLQPLRTGAARIALGAQALGAEPIAIVPVGLTFEEKGRFRSNALMAIGAPITPATDASPENTDAVRSLTEEIDAGLRDVTLNYASWDAAHLVEQSAEIYAADEARTLPGRARLVAHFPLRRAFGDRYEAAREAHPERVATLEGVVKRYDRLLRFLALRDDHITSRYPWRSALAYVGYRIPNLLLRLPFAAVGLVLNYLPYRFPGWVARLVRDEGDQPATYKVLTGLVAFPLCWALECVLAFRAWGVPGAAAMAVIAPATGWIALRFYERNESFWRELRAWLTLRVLPDRGAELRALRRAIRDELAALVTTEEKQPLEHRGEQRRDPEEAEEARDVRHRGEHDR